MHRCMYTPGNSASLHCALLLYIMAFMRTTLAAIATECGPQGRQAGMLHSAVWFDSNGISHCLPNGCHLCRLRP